MKKFLALFLFAFLCITLVNAQAPTISSFTPLTAKPGDAVTLTGTGFNTNASDNIVYCGATKATVTAASSTSVTITVPSCATHNYISLLNTGTGLMAMSSKKLIPTYSPSKPTIAASDFDPGVVFPNAGGSIFATTGDFDGDGKPDIAMFTGAAEVYPGTVDIYRNTSTPGTVNTNSLASKVSFTAGWPSSAIATGDIDGDGKLDIVVINGKRPITSSLPDLGLNISVLRNTSSLGNISFAPDVKFELSNASSSTGPGVQKPVLADFDGDGKLDIAIQKPGVISVLRNTSSIGSINLDPIANITANTFSATFYTMAICDFDANGKPDIAVINGNSGQTTNYLFLNNSSIGSFNFATAGYGGVGPSSSLNSLIFFPFLTVGDIDGNGQQDIVAASNFTSGSTTAFNVFRNGLTARLDIGTGNYGILLSDMSGDGKLDVVSIGGSGVGIYRNIYSSGTYNAITSFAAKASIITGSSNILYDVSDIDGDSRPDILSGTSSGLAIYRNSSPACTNTSSTLTVTACGNYTWADKGNTIYTSNNNTDTIQLTNAGGCDSIVTLNLTINATSTSSTNLEICPSELPYTWNGLTFTGGGSQTYHTTNSLGCDSAATLNLTIKSPSTSTTYLSIPNSSLPYVWNGLTFTSAGTQTAHLTNSVGCDSAATLNLSVLSISILNDQEISCYGNNDGSVQADAQGGSGNFVYDIDNQLDFTNTSGFFDLLTPGTHTICAKEVSTNVEVCGTILVTEPDPIQIILTVDDLVSCAGNDGSISASVIGGVTNNQPYLTTWTSGVTTTGIFDLSVSGLIPGTYTLTVEDDNYCHSTASITVNAAPAITLGPSYAAIPCHGGTTTISPNASGGIGSLTTTISGGTFTVNAGTYTITATDTKGCSETKVITITQPSVFTSSINVNVCNSYYWSVTNQTYTSSGTYSAPFTTASGCDSTSELHLTIRSSNSSTTTISQVGCYTWAANNTTYTISGIYSLTYTNAAGCDSISILNLTITPSVKLSIKAMLAGPFDSGSGLMHDSLRVLGLIPSSEPYSTPPYNRTPIGEAYGETLLSSSVLNITGSNAIVDWVMIEIRSAANPSTILANKRALIQRDGDIVSTDGVSLVTFTTIPNGYYYVSVKHRNHLGIMTSAPLALSGCSSTSIDFTTSSPVYTISSITNLPRKLIGTVYAMWSGDANANKNVKYNGMSNDKDHILTAVGAGTPNNSLGPVYRMEDGNMDGKVRFNNTDNDRSIIINNVGTSTPNNILNQHTPN